MNFKCFCQRYARAKSQLIDISLIGIAGGDGWGLEVESE